METGDIISIIPEEIITRISPINEISRRLNISIELARSVLDESEKLSPLEVKTEMYHPLLFGRYPLDYDIAAQNVALRKLRSKEPYHHRFIIPYTDS